MKQTITEIFIEVEETIEVKSAQRKDHSKMKFEKDAIEICPHCHQAIFETKEIEIEGDFK